VSTCQGLRVQHLMVVDTAGVRRHLAMLLGTLTAGFECTGMFLVRVSGVELRFICCCTGAQQLLVSHRRGQVCWATSLYKAVLSFEVSAVSLCGQLHMSGVDGLTVVCGPGAMA
jgi:hypothetical protein